MFLDQTSPPDNALFQLQVKFQVRNGCTCLRVITQARPVTESRMLAEQGLNPAVMGMSSVLPLILVIVRSGLVCLGRTKL